MNRIGLGREGIDQRSRGRGKNGENRRGLGSIKGKRTEEEESIV